MNTLNMRDRVRHEIPGKFYFFHITEELSYLEIYLIYTHPKLYLFTRKELTFLDDYVIIKESGSI
jgi:hypothetical protein